MTENDLDKLDEEIAFLSQKVRKMMNFRKQFSPKTNAGSKANSVTGNNSFRFKEKKNDEITCFRCGGVGHVVKDCPTRSDYCEKADKPEKTKSDVHDKTEC